MTLSPGCCPLRTISRSAFLHVPERLMEQKEIKIFVARILKIVLHNVVYNVQGPPHTYAYKCLHTYTYLYIHTCAYIDTY